MKRLVITGIFMTLGLAVVIAMTCGKNQESRSTSDNPVAFARPPSSDGSAEDAGSPLDEELAGAVLSPSPRAKRREDASNDRWDQLSAAERIDVARETFRTALANLEARVDVAQNVVTAEAALTVLRPELYTSPTGQREHRALEAELEALTVELAAEGRVRSAGSKDEGEP